MVAGDRPIHVLHLEDNPTDRIITASILQEHGMEVFPTPSLSGCIRIMDKNRIDVAVLDLNVKDSNGLETIIRFQQRYPDTPVIVLTGEHPNAGLEAIAYGADDFLIKVETDFEKLVEVVLYTHRRNQRHNTARKDLVTETRHNIATPLTPIMLQLAVMRKKLEGDEEGLKQVDSMERNIQRLREELHEFDSDTSSMWATHQDDDPDPSGK